MNNLTVKHCHVEKIPKDWEVVAFYESCLTWNKFNGSIVLVCNRAFLLSVVEALELMPFFVDIIVTEDYKHGITPLYKEFPLGTIFTTNTNALYADVNYYTFDNTKTVLHTGEKGNIFNKEMIVWNNDKNLDDYIALCLDYISQGENAHNVECKLLYDMYRHNSAMIYHDAGVNTQLLNNNTNIAEKFINLRMQTMQNKLGKETTQHLKDTLCQLQTFRA